MFFSLNPTYFFFSFARWYFGIDNNNLSLPFILSPWLLEDTGTMFLAKPIVAVLALALLVQQSQAVYEVSITLPQPQQNVLFLPRDSPSVQVVMPSVNHSWGIRPDGDVALTTNNAVGTIVAGPGGQPDNRIGPGSVEFLTRFNPGGKPQLTAPKDVIENVRFTDLTTLNYMSFTQVYASRNWLSFSTNVEIDLDGNPSTRGDRVTMVYEPCYTLNNCSTFVQVCVTTHD
mgnify:CR=1 FL=1|tara:strand:+ start:665 stop:1354 length:690 start_codon:yes stop_codon:yes gene_type:complete